MSGDKAVTTRDKKGDATGIYGKKLGMIQNILQWKEHARVPHHKELFRIMSIVVRMTNSTLQFDYLSMAVKKKNSLIGISKHTYLIIKYKDVYFYFSYTCICDS